MQKIAKGFLRFRFGAVHRLGEAPAINAIAQAPRLLAALVNPLDEVALVGVLRSPIVGLTDEEIFRLGKTGWQELFETRFGHLRKRAGFVSPDRLLPIQPDLSPRARANVDKLFSWLRRNRRLMAHYEALAMIAVGFAKLAMIGVMLKRLT